MKIQIITNNSINASTLKKEIKFVNFDSIDNFDDFDFNIIDLNNYDLWVDKDYLVFIHSFSNKMKYIEEMIIHTNQDVLVILPRNIIIESNMLGKKEEMKDSVDYLRNSITNAFVEVYREYYENEVPIIYDKNRINILGNKYKADFFITETGLIDIIKHASNNQSKGLIVKVNECLENLYFTSLYDFLEKGNLIDVINELFFKSTEPEWIKEYNFYTDIEMKKSKEVLLKKIEQINGLIEKNNEELEKNNKYKKVLYASGDLLVSIVTEIFEIMLNYNCSDFIDKKKEDLRIKYDNQTFIIEIKGENDGVNKSNISQLVTHIEEYEEKLTKTNQPSENIKGILIKNEFKNKPINEREKIHHEVIEKSERNDCLIITSKLLLDLFEMFLRDEITSEEIKTILIKQTGLINI